MCRACATSLLVSVSVKAAQRDREFGIASWKAAGWCWLFALRCDQGISDRNPMMPSSSTASSISVMVGGASERKRETQGERERMSDEGAAGAMAGFSSARQAQPGQQSTLQQQQGNFIQKQTEVQACSALSTAQALACYLLRPRPCCESRCQQQTQGCQNRKHITHHSHWPRLPLRAASRMSMLAKPRATRTELDDDAQYAHRRGDEVAGLCRTWWPIDAS